MEKEKIGAKVEKLVRWVEKYPELKPSQKASEDGLKKYATTEEEYTRIAAEYEEMRDCYAYIRVRASKNKMPKELVAKCKEGNIGGVFGYSTRTEELAKEKGITVEEAKYILEKFGTFAHFVELYQNSQLSQDDLSLANAIISNVLDVDFSPNHKNYDRLYCAITGLKTKRCYLGIYSSKKLQETLQTLLPRESEILEKRYGLVSSKEGMSLKEVAEEFKVSREAIYQVEKRAIRRLRHPSRQRAFQYYFSGLEDEYGLPEETKEEMRAFISDLYTSSLLLKNDEAVVARDKENSRILQGIELMRNVNCAILEGKIQRRSLEERMSAQNREESETLEEGVFEGKRDNVVEAEEEPEPIPDPKPTASELQEVRAKRDFLREQIKELEEKVAQAKALMQDYEKILGEDEIASSEEEK